MTFKSPLKYSDLREFMAFLEQRGELVRIKQEVDPNLEMTEISDRTLRAKGPALYCSKTPKATTHQFCATCLAPQTESPWVWVKKMSAPSAMWELC